MEIFIVIRSHVVYKRSEGSFLKNLKNKDGSHHWFVIVVLEWHSESVEAFQNLTLHNVLVNYIHGFQSRYRLE